MVPQGDEPLKGFAAGSLFVALNEAIVASDPPWEGRGRAGVRSLARVWMRGIITRLKRIV